MIVQFLKENNMSMENGKSTNLLFSCNFQRRLTTNYSILWNYDF